jgi:hypothetical protein
MSKLRISCIDPATGTDAAMPAEFERSRGRAPAGARAAQ